MGRTVIKTFAAGLSLLAIACVGFIAHTKTSPALKNTAHHLEKRQSFEDILQDSYLEELDHEPLPGQQVVCYKAGSAKKVNSETLTGFIESKDDYYIPVGRHDKSQKSGNRKVPLSQIRNNNPIGCCPPGDPDGKPYHSGFACCVDTVINTSSHFCCISKAQVLGINQEELDYCYPLDSIPFCRLKDLELDEKRPMSYKCATKRKTPSRCKFKCPPLSWPKNDIDEAICLKNGVWDQKPICCEGCDRDFKLDLWLLVEVDQDIGNAAFKMLKKYIKTMLSYLPVSQDGVRVGITVFNWEVFSDDTVWDLSAYDSHRQINAAVDNLPFDGTGSNTGAALSWVANNAFTKFKGNRENVPNQVVAIVYGKPDGAFFEGAGELKTIADVLAIAVRKDMSDEDLAVMGSGEVHRVDTFKDLPDLNKVLFKRVCGENCLRGYY